MNVEATDHDNDRAALATFRERLASGDEELIPAEIVDRLLSGENRLRVWREHRGLTIRALAEKAGLAQPYLSQIETGRRRGRTRPIASSPGHCPSVWTNC